MDSFLHFLDTLENEPEVLIFVGAGASMDGFQDGQAFPSFRQLIDRVVESYGVEAESDQDRFAAFLRIIDTWTEEDSLEDRFTKLLDGEPGPGHYYLAALILSAASTGKNLCMLLTTNFDRLIETALTHFTSEVISQSLGDIHIGDKARRLLVQLWKRANSGIPVVLKLFGDTTAIPPVFLQKNMNFDSAVKETLKGWLRRPVLFVGYSFSDNLILDLLAASDGSKPIFVVDPVDHLNPMIIRHDRVHHIRQSFSPFLKQVVEQLKKRHSSVVSSFDDFICRLDPRKLYVTAEDIRTKVKVASEYMLQRVNSQLVAGASEVIPVGRNESAPPWQQFLEDSSKCLVLVGRSGSGKTVLLYDLASEASTSRLCLFYSVQQLDNTSGSLTDRLAQDFCCDSKNLYELLDHFSELLNSEESTLLIIVDGINETEYPSLSRYKVQFEELASRLPQSIRIIYSCRTSAWQNRDYATASIPSETYFHDSPCFLPERYTENELRAAFLSYQRSYGFLADFRDLEDEQIAHMSDPFLLKLIAVVYSGKQLPKSIQIHTVFEHYHKQLVGRLASPTIDYFIETIIRWQLEQLFSHGRIISNRLEHAELIRLQSIRDCIKIQQSADTRPGNPFTILTEEGILVQVAGTGNVLSFFHDRFYEYLLSQYLIDYLDAPDVDDYLSNIQSALETISGSDASVYDAMVLFAAQHGTEHAGHSFMGRDLLSRVVSTRNRTLYYFTVDVARRSLTDFYLNRDAAELLRRFSVPVLFDIIRSRPEFCDLLVDGLLSKKIDTLRRCVQTINSRTDGAVVLKNVSTRIVGHCQSKESLRSSDVMAIAYLCGCFLASDDTGGFEPLFRFLQRVFPDGIRPQHATTISRVLKAIVEKELVHFVPSLHGDNSFSYLWSELSSDKKDDALYMAEAMYSDFPVSENRRLQDIIRMYGSELLSLHVAPNNRSLLTCKIEYKIAKWVLVRRSRTAYAEVKAILEKFMDSGFWLTSDFCLCVMKYILQQVHSTDKRILKDGYETLKEWTCRFERDDPRFFYALQLEDPFKTHFNSLSQVSRIEAQFFHKGSRQIEFLRERLESPDILKVRLAVLSLRQLWRDHCDSVLATLETVFDHSDRDVSRWVDATLGEIYLLHPGKVDMFLRRMQSDIGRVHGIRYENRTGETSGVEYFGEALYAKLFLSEERTRREFVEVYRQLLHNCDSVTEFCDYFTGYLSSKLAST